jgi:hypothetical protein
MQNPLRIWLLAAAIAVLACAGAIYVERHQRGTFDTLREAEQMTREGDRMAVLVGREIEGSITREERTELAALRQRAKDRKKASEAK